MSLLETVCGHRDLNNLTAAQQQTLCGEIREFLISHISQTGGHLASNLGVVELSVAIETVFNTHTDRLVFDVGHQSYVHKLLTGRQADFPGLRQYGGMAGFPKPSESDADAFVAGHASSSISIALGMARARSLQKQDYHIIALLGDGAATGGMAYEGLNDAAESGEPMVVILNDNEMSIDPSVGGVSRHLSRLRTKERYLGMKSRYRSFLTHIPGGAAIYGLTHRLKGRLKRMLLPTTIFENMGMLYLGPVDGHDLPELIRILRIARDLKEPVLVHVLTQKGRGYAPAEQDPAKFHGVGRFDPVTGQTAAAGATFSDAFGTALSELAKVDDRICAITAAMPGGTGLLRFKEVFPKRLFDVGIAEEHAASMAGGLAKQGMIPVLALYSTFLQRAYDQILQDIAMLKLHVVLAVDRAGLVGEDGETHHGIFDVGMLRQAPGMTVLCPVSCAELSHMLTWAVKEHTGPVAIRYPRGGDRSYSEDCWKGLSHTVVCHRRGGDLTVLTYGTLLNNVLEAAQLLSEQGIEATVLRLTAVAPLDTDAIIAGLCGGHLLIVEEVNANSGIAGQIAWDLQQKNAGCRIHSLDLGNSFVTHGTLAQLYAHHSLDGRSIADFIRKEHFYEKQKTPGCAPDGAVLC